MRSGRCNIVFLSVSSVDVSEHFLLGLAWLHQEMCQNTELTNRFQQAFGGEGPAWLLSRLTVLCLAAVGRRKEISSTEFCAKKQHMISRKYGSVSLQDLVSRH